MRLAIAAVIVLAPAVHAQELGPEVIAEAIAHGTTAKEVAPLRVSAGRAECFVTTPFLRVAAAAAKAKREYSTFTAESVTPEMAAPVLEVTCPSKSVVEAGNPAFGFASVQRIVITDKGGANPVQPLKTTTFEETYGNKLGGSWTANGMVAYFPPDALKVGREIHVIFDQKVSAKFSKCDDCRIELKDLKGLR